MTEELQRELILALWDAGLCVCETHIIEPYHPGLVDDIDYIIGRLNEGR
jgi:hypothetical protein